MIELEELMIKYTAHLNEDSIHLADADKRGSAEEWAIWDAKISIYKMILKDLKTKIKG